MKTKHLDSLSQLDNNYLTQLLAQLINRYCVVQLFYTPQTEDEPALLVVHLATKKEVVVLQKQPWVGKLHRNHNTWVCFFYNTQLHSFHKSGHPFILGYCSSTAVIYTREAVGEPLLVHETNLKKQLKKFKAYKARFYHDHDLLHSQIQPLLAADCAAAVLLQYESLLAYDVEYLENLYMGSPTRLQSLHNRIAALTPLVPQIQRYFVKDKGNRYYLTYLIDKAKEASLDRQSYFADENYEAFRLAEAGLQDLIIQRLKALKQIIKGKKRKPLPVTTANGSNKNLALPESAMAVLLKIPSLEEVYLFHHAVYGEVQTFYLLLIGPRLGNAYLKDLTTKLNAASGTGREYVLIGHSRLWIQKWLFYYQSFFYMSMAKENLVFTSSPYHPVPHWEVPYTPEYPDLEHFYERTEEVYNQFLFMVDCDTVSCQGITNLFSLFFLCFCRTYLYASMGYYPNWLHSYALWQLCLYANPNLRRYDYFFKEVDTSFFEFLDQYRTVQVINKFTFEEKRKCLLKIGEGLMGELNSKFKVFT